ncbi:hypothetical protein J437_LFUL009777 [Ladona fulva]|uniref:G protein pathway suppressor 2 n=1 Tax=Ladona fulva TaxID=123851 RepID=A0A8K0K2M6_LADFU|nr:hypothetical protein J437_LFUL009777 [Ladona fulva]
MPAVLVEKPKRNEAMWNALKAHIIRERQRKKQEQEADAEVERQRKERERQQKQDVMTLGETREQISHLEAKLAQLKDEKHQLFLQLKKVLNEDDIRRRQLVKESNDMLNMHGNYPAVALGSGGHPPIFLQANMSLAGRTPLYKVTSGHGQHNLLPPLNQYEVIQNGAMMGALKRTHSPSPPLHQGYHQGYGYKPGSIPAYPQQKVDDGRRSHEYVRAVLWNKNSPLAPYPPTQPPAGSSGAFYSHAPVGASGSGAQVVVGGAPPVHPPHSHPVSVGTTAVSYPTPTAAQTVYTYAGTHPQYSQAPPVAPAPPRDEPAGKHLPQQHPVSSSGASGGVYLSHVAAPRGIPHNQAYVSSLHQQQPMEHISSKSSNFPASGGGGVSEPEKYYTVGPPQSSIAGIRPQASHIHASPLPLQQPPPPQSGKTGGITSGYPIRAQQGPPHVTSGSYVTPHSAYVTQAPGPRLSYSQAGPSHASHPPPHGRYSVPGLQREV